MNPFKALLSGPIVWLRVALGVVVIVALLGAWWKVAHHYEAKGAASIRKEWDDAIAKANAETAKRAALNTDRKSEAEVKRDEHIKRIQVDSDRNRIQLASLHDLLDRTRAEARTSLTACTQRADTLSELFEASTNRYSELAKKADGHAVDVQTLTEAWPK